ncbi:DUF3306 domain-containing protein [Bordetella bronchiseptica]|uniref:DUF3306 domain-containing protein n=1 Tax=Bordetella bronchiseptica TaxID=518 RepID=UPI000459A6EA|nr:DUF3306 domain-containing protein [Bordetella bronchiseptica]KCV63593.1 PF11748 family protein [Bordetella bronchiseptica 99-R-0433]
MSQDPASFLGRWSRRKSEARQQAETAVEPAAGVAQAPLADAPPVGAPDIAARPEAAPERADAAPVQAPGPAVDAGTELPLPTLDDVRALTLDSDFSRFVAGGVSPDVKNAALKKLFTDPHYNVMDGLDVYIDDYTQLEGLPQETVRRMASAKVFSLFEDDAPTPEQGGPADGASSTGPRTPDAMAVPDAAPAGPASAPDAIQSALPRDDAAGPAGGPLPDAEPRRD